jgi:hypothetical protein
VAEQDLGTAESGVVRAAATMLTFTQVKAAIDEVAPPLRTLFAACCAERIFDVEVFGRPSR